MISTLSMNIRLRVSSMSVELWKTLFDWATVVLIAFTVVSGAGALITGDIITKRLEAKLHQFGMDLEKQKGETAIAQAEVLRLQQQRLPRTLKFDSNESLQALIASLKHTPLRKRFYPKGAMDKRLPPPRPTQLSHSPLNPKSPLPP